MHTLWKCYNPFLHQIHWCVFWTKASTEDIRHEENLTFYTKSFKWWISRIRLHLNSDLETRILNIINILIISNYKYQKKKSFIEVWDFWTPLLIQYIINNINSRQMQTSYKGRKSPAFASKEKIQNTWLHGNKNVFDVYRNLHSLGMLPEKMSNCTRTQFGLQHQAWLVRFLQILFNHNVNRSNPCSINVEHGKKTTTLTNRHACVRHSSKCKLVWLLASSW